MLYFRQKRLQEKKGFLYVSKKSSLEILLNLESFVDCLSSFSKIDTMNLKYFSFLVEYGVHSNCTHYLQCKWCKNLAEFQNFYIMIGFLKKNRFLKKKVVIFTFSRPLIAKLDNVVS